ncbi:protein of unknown function [Flavobacterium glycines]|uniref:DUF4861 domain-containing protein n=1 Tax=Flavobacterium glycines TaxID=551990 RepID=A0A1B9DGX6_9FLAO|nr:DUF4861 family protein [Flavobacterium glycines]OCB68920.1 hypothetical protein FBGL_15195 [Flavobacterium glycines]GEL11112.1 DUF4861 domain-containing protein [Flavobacterium glycines]SDJ28269.1 protein of unknown function [Flavobacterium glycines]
MKIRSQLSVILGSLFVLGYASGCSVKNKLKAINVEVKNNLDFNRKEIVSIPIGKLSGLLKNISEKNIRVKFLGANEYLRTQWIDYNNDGKGDELLFEAEIKANSVAKYVIVTDIVKEPESKIRTYSRFVPERIDDYAWENNKVAFRAYGPVAQQLVEEGKEGGTLSSGIDLWLKKVDYSIIDSWYQKNVANPGYYHIEHGEGYDPYHVGASRGTGGTGLWEKDSLQVSKNYVSYKTIATGPLRTVFELTYAPWSSYGVYETKRISLDLNSNFSKFEVSYQADKEIPNYTVGITLHDKKGEVNINKPKGWFRHWEPIDSAFVGEGIVLSPKLIDTAFVHDSKTADQSNLLILTNPEDKITYYAGFAWTGSKQIRDVMDWDEMLDKQAKIIANPLEVKVIK